MALNGIKEVAKECTDMLYSCQESFYIQNQKSAMSGIMEDLMPLQTVEELVYTYVHNFTNCTVKMI